MARLPAITIMLAGTLGLSGAASMQPSPETLSEQALAALDPTRIARSICGQRGGSALAKRLEQAADYSAANGIGKAAMPLFGGIARSPDTGEQSDRRRPALVRSGHGADLRLQPPGRDPLVPRSRRHAPGCAMCWWAEAVAKRAQHQLGHGFGPEPQRAGRLKEAQALMAGASPLERELIEAQLQRFFRAPDADRGTLDCGLCRYDAGTGETPPRQ